MSKRKRNYTVDRFLDTYPQNVEGYNNSSFFYYRNILINKFFSVIKIEGLLDWWDYEYFRDTLFLEGYIGITQSNIGIVPLRCGFYGQNIFERPTELIFTPPAMESFTRKLHEECELIFFWENNRNYLNINNIVCRYAEKLALIDGSIDISLINSRVAHVFEVSTEGEKRTLEKMYDDVSNGNPVIVVKKGQNAILNEENKRDFLNVKNTYIGNDLLMTKRTIMEEFLTEIGIHNANTDKRERLNGDEVNSNNQEVRANITVFVDTINRQFEKANKLFNLNLKASINEDMIKYHDKEVTEDAI